MSQVYVILLAIAALLISSIGAIFSIAGLAKLFSGASVSVTFMASSLEFGKIIVAGFLYRYWIHTNRVMKYYLTIALMVLMCITSIGIFGFLSNAYQKSSHDLKLSQLKIRMMDTENLKVLEEIKGIEKFISEVPQNRISKKFELQKESEPRIQQLRQRSHDLLTEMGKVNLEILNTQTKVGPLIYVADSLRIDVDTVAKYLILTIVMVFDPFAICLVFAWSLASHLNEKERANERLIASQIVDKPIDYV